MASEGHFTVVYATPEKLLGWESGLKKLAKNSKLVCLAIDESHCVSDWGHDFRPQYRQLVDIRRVIGYGVPVCEQKNGSEGARRRSNVQSK